MSRKNTSPSAFAGGQAVQLESDFGFDFRGGPSFALLSKGWEASEVFQRLKQTRPEASTCPNPVPDLSRQLFYIFRLLHQGKRQDIGFRRLIRFVLQFLNQLQQAVDVMPQRFLVFFELHFWIGSWRERNVVRSARTAGIRDLRNMRRVIMPLALGAS